MLQNALVNLEESIQNIDVAELNLQDHKEPTECKEQKVTSEDLTGVNEENLFNLAQNLEKVSLTSTEQSGGKYRFEVQFPWPSPELVEITPFDDSMTIQLNKFEQLKQKIEQVLGLKIANCKDNRDVQSILNQEIEGVLDLIVSSLG